MDRIGLIVVALIVSTLAVTAGYHARAATKARAETASVRDEFADYKATQEKNARLLIQARAAETARIVADNTKAANVATAKIRALEAAVARGERNARGLRDELASASTAGRGLSLDPNASAECKAAGATIGMLTDMLGECSSRRRAVALYADRTRIAAEECAARHDALIPPGVPNVARTNHEPDPP